MTLDSINYLAVLVAATVSFTFGGIWYAILGKFWMAATGRDQRECKPDRKILGVRWQLPFTLVMLLIIAFTLAGLMGHITGGEIEVRDGLISAVLIWAGFIATTMSANYAFQDLPARALAIDAGHWFGVLVIQGAIIGHFG